MAEDTGAAVWLLVPETERLGTAGGRVLLVADEPGDGGGGPGRPRVTLPRRTWVPEGVGALSAQAEARLGCGRRCSGTWQTWTGSTSARSRCTPRGGPRRRGAGGPRSPRCAPPRAGRGRGHRRRSSGGSASRPGRRRCRRSRPAWERRGWLDDVVAWADPALARAGTPRTGQPVPVKRAWGGSAILKLPTAAGDCYLKAGYTRPPGEAALLAAPRPAGRTRCRRWWRGTPRATWC